VTEAAYARQEGGTHYVTLPIQPIKFAMQNHWDSAAFSVLKYVTRHRSKNGLVDLKKARHFVDLRLTERASWWRPYGLISMGEYCRVNLIDERDQPTLLFLESWVKGGSTEQPVIHCLDMLIADPTNGDTGPKPTIAPL
jgi:hypothetical protein